MARYESAALPTATAAHMRCIVFLVLLCSPCSRACAGTGKLRRSGRYLQPVTGSLERPQLQLRGGFEAVARCAPDAASLPPLHELYRSCLHGNTPAAFSRASSFLSGWGTAATMALLFGQVLRILFTAILQRVVPSQLPAVPQGTELKAEHCKDDAEEQVLDESFAAAMAGASSVPADQLHAAVIEDEDIRPRVAEVDGTPVQQEQQKKQEQHQPGKLNPPATTSTGHAEEELIAELSRLGILTGDERPDLTIADAVMGDTPDDSQQHFPDIVQEQAVSLVEIDDVASQVSSAESADALGTSTSEPKTARVKDSRHTSSVLKQVFGDSRQHDVMQEAQTPPGLTTELMTHQKMGLGWMQRREEAGHVATTWWEQIGEGLYGYETPTWVNLLTGQDRSIDNPPMEARGGILADDMGLGKTLTILALIVSDLAAQRAAESPASVEGLPCDSASAQLQQSSDSDSVSSLQQAHGGRPTLIVCPLSVLHNWQTQINAHANNGLRVLIYHGAARTRDLEELCGQHIVLTTYSVLQSDMRGSRGRDDAGTRASVLHAVHWRRVVLDEAHVIANPKAKQSKAVMLLQADRRWVVTGTPLQNKMDDLMTLFSFLRVEPLDDTEWFRRLVGDPSRSKCPRRQAEALQVVRSVLAEYCLRRTKDQTIRGKPIMRLPGKTEIVRTLHLSEFERALYDQLFQSGKAMFRTYMREGSVMTHYTKILERLLRSLAPHPLRLPPTNGRTPPCSR